MWDYTMVDSVVVFFMKKVKIFDRFIAKVIFFFIYLLDV